MITRLRQVFQRYAYERLHLEKPGFELIDETGNVIGHIDRIVLNGNRLTVQGWTEADQVALILNGVRTTVVPDLAREDVTAVRGPGFPATPGFSIDMPFELGRAIFSVEYGDMRYIHDLAVFEHAQIVSGRKQLWLPFLRDLTVASPAIVSWFFTRSDASRQKIKKALNFNLIAEPAVRMNMKLFVEDFDDLTPAAEGEMLPPALVPEGLMDTPVTIVLPVYNAFDLLPEVLQRVLDNTDLPWHLVIIEDCSSDAQVRPFLRDWVARQEAETAGRITLIENEQNKGFIRSVNSAFDKARELGNHVILLNSDAFVPEGWASRLMRPILAHEDVATVTPMSNDAEIFTVPVICQRQVLRPGEADAIDRLARTFHPDADLAEAPTGVGFCMAMHLRYLQEFTDFDVKFGRGYGEEVDWCQRVRKVGGRHLGLPSLFVEHRGGTSFGSAEKMKLVMANNAVISRRYPTYDQEVQDFIRHDPLSTPRLVLGIAFAAGRQQGPVPIYMAHDLGGGAENYLQARIKGDIEAIGAAIVLRVGGGFRWQVELYTEHGVTRGVTNDFGFVKKLLQPLGETVITYSCAVGDRDPIELPERLMELKRGDQDRIEVMFHDYFPISPSYTLLDSNGLYTGLPDPENEDSAHRYRRPDGRRVRLKEWQHVWGKLMLAADEITVFSEDSKALVVGAYPKAAEAVVVRPHTLLHAVPKTPAGKTADGKPVIGVLGNIGYQKGAAVIADLSKKLAETGEGRLVVIGNVDPAYPIAAPSEIHGTYQIRDIPDLIARYGISQWLIPSVWPETFSYATHEALATGLPVWCFDLGAQAEAVARTAETTGKGGIIALNDGQPPIDHLIETLVNTPAEEVA